MTETHIAIVDLADELRVRKQRIFKVLGRLGIRTSVSREFARRGQSVATVTESEAARVRLELTRSAENQLVAGTTERAEVPPYDSGAEVGLFYIVQLEPQHDPGRVKVGFTTELEARLRKHRTSAPFARCERSWPCRRAWERAAIECVTTDCEQLHTEVFRAASVAHVVARAESFFSVMPQLSAAQEGIAQLPNDEATKQSVEVDAPRATAGS